ncbi:MAG: galactose-1-phosphate uridylyltransferase [Planctomycetota bacterium]
MPELRKDPILGRWIIIATERAARPTDFRSGTVQRSGGFCPFCEGNEDKTPPEIAAYRNSGTAANGPGWRVRIVPNKFPALRIEGNLDKSGVGMYDIMNGIGAHEVIIECPTHNLSLAALTDENVEEIIAVYRERLADLKKDSRLAYGLIFKNVGSVAGASLEHTHSQLIATPVVPNLVQREMRGARDYFAFRGRCLFCDMIQQELMTESRIAHESDEFVSFCPFAARFPFETWILPRKHLSHFEAMTKAQAKDLATHLKSVLRRLETALEEPPYNYIIHTAPWNEPHMEEFHWHVEIIPRLTKVAGFEWGTGFYINPIPPEKAAEFMREVDS